MSPPCPLHTWHLPLAAPAGAKLDDFADFTTFGLGTALLLQPQGVLGGLLSLAYVLAVFARLCFFSSGKMSPPGTGTLGVLLLALNCWHPTGIPFTYRGLPCPYASALLASTFLLSGGHLALLRVAAAAMILFMADCGFYPHDRVLESQLWKKLVYAGGKDGDEALGVVAKGEEEQIPQGFSRSAGVVAVLLAPTAVAAVYCLAWATSYIVFPFALWSCKA